MSQVTQLPPPPIGPVSSGSKAARLMVFAVLVLLGLIAAWELQLVNSAAGKEAAQRIRENARVRAEFGDDIRLPLLLGWHLGDQGVLYGYVSGKRSHGYAVVNLRSFAGEWAISALEVQDPSQGYLINLAAPGVPAKKEQLKGSGTLYFVALGDAATSDVSELADYFEKEFAIPVKTLPSISLPEEAYDARRKQWLAESLVQWIAAKYPEIAADPEARVVGVLEDDAYIRTFNWNFAFSYRATSKFSVISAARLDTQFDHFPPNQAIRMERLRKVAMKNVGLLYLGFEESEDPRSVDAFEATTEDIDRMGSVYLASDVRTRPETENLDGTPCLSFRSANVAGVPLQRPISNCWQRGDGIESTEFQIDLARGRFQLTRNDLYRSGPVPLLLQRMNFSHVFDDKIRAFGKDSWQSLDDTVWSVDPNSIQTISVRGAEFHRITPGTGFSAEAKYRAGPNAGAFRSALLRWENGGWRIDTREGEVWRYLGCGPKTPVQCYYMGESDAAGDGIEVKRDLTTGHMQQVSQKTNPDLPAAAALDHTWTTLYDGDKITEIHDSDGRTARYRYDPAEYLTDVEADGHHIHYDYDDAHRITGVVEDDRRLRIHYDSEGRAERLDFPNGLGYRIQYSGQAIEVTGPGGRYTVTLFPTYFRTVEHK